MPIIPLITKVPRFFFKHMQIMIPADVFIDQKMHTMLTGEELSGSKTFLAARCYWNMRRPP